MKFDPTLKYEGPLKITQIAATNQEVVAASTGGGKYDATQSGPEIR